MYKICSDFEFLYLNETWFSINSNESKQTEISPKLMGLIAEIRELGDQFDADELKCRLLSFGIKGDEHNEALDTFIEISLFESENSTKGTNCLDYETKRFLNFCHSTKFEDYTKQDVLTKDYENMKRYSSKSEAPSYIYPLSSRDGCKLPNPILTSISTASRDLSVLLYFSFGIKSVEEFHDHKVTLRYVPSNGARHPFEAIVISKNSTAVEDGIYYYDPLHHSLNESEIKIKTPFEDGLFIVIIGVWERVQWRYRNSWSYRDFWLDYGHILGQLKLLASELDISIEELDIEDADYSSDLLSLELVGILKIG